MLLFLNRGEVGRALATDWKELIFWGLLIVLINLIHFDIEPVQFTLDTPLLLATALLYHPAVAATIALVSSVDAREFRRAVSFSRAIFNRSQIAIGVFLAGVVYHALARPSSPWPSAIMGTALAMAVFYVLNAALVIAFVVARGRGTPLETLKRLAIGKPLGYVFTYFGYGILALVLGRLFKDVGAWSVVLFLIPIVVAHLALVRAERLQSMAEQMHARERLLELLSDKIVDERRDERSRIASGLHDDVLQSLIRISQLGFFLSREARSGTQASLDAEELVHLSDDTVQALREVVGDLRKSPVGRGGLVRTLQGLGRDLSIEWRIPISISGPTELRVSPEAQLTAYHAAKEGILNALKHAEAATIDVRVELFDRTLHLTVADDGRGFLKEQVDESSHFGLGLMRQRVERLGGVVQVESEIGRGTQLLVQIPV